MSVLIQAQAKLDFLVVQSKSTSSMTVSNSESQCTCHTHLWNFWIIWREARLLLFNMNRFHQSYKFYVKFCCIVKLNRACQAKLAFWAVQSKSTPSMTVLDSESYGTCQIAIIEYSELDVKQNSFYSSWTNLNKAINFMWNFFAL